MIRDDFNDVVHRAAQRGADLDQHFTGNDGAVFAHFRDGGHAYARRFCQFLLFHFPVDQQLKELFITCGHWLHPRNIYDYVLYHIFPDFSTVFSKNPAISSFFVLPIMIVSWAKMNPGRGHAHTPYFFVYCAAKNEGGTIRNGLDFPVEESYNPNALGDRGKTPRIHGSVFHTTTCLTTTAFGGRGNSGEKSAGEQVFRTKQRQM